MKFISETRREGLLLRISELTSPKLMLSLFSLSINLRQFSNLYSYYYRVVWGPIPCGNYRNGLLLFLVISIVKISMLGSLRSDLSWKLIVSRMKKPTPPTDLFLSLETQV